MAEKAKGKAADPTEIEKAVEENAVVITMSKRQDAVDQVSNLAELQERFGSTLSWQDIEPSFLVAMKDQFEGVPFVIAGFRMNESTKFLTKDEVNPEILVPGRFVSMLVAAYDENTGDFISPWVILNDGSTGIRDSLVRYVKKVSGDADIDATKEEFNSWAAKVPPIKCERGLRASHYNYDTGESVVEATTWYIA